MALDSETLDQLLDSVVRFVRDRLVPLEHKIAEDDAIPADVKQDIRDMGLFGLSIPQEYGGLGLDMAEEVLVAFELGQTSPAFRSLIGTNNGIGSQGIIMDGTEAHHHHSSMLEGAHNTHSVRVSTPARWSAVSLSRIEITK